MDSRNASHVDWLSLPTELLCLTFKMLDVTALTRCMFVCRNWNRAAQYVAEHKDLWKDIVSTYIIDNGASFHLKSVDLSWRDCFINQLLWTHIGKAAMSVKHIYCKHLIRNIHVYKNNLIVVHGNGVTYYKIDSGYVLRIIRTKCHDFKETNKLLLRYNFYGDGRLRLYEKKQIEDFNIERMNRTDMTSVVHYKLVGDCLYTIDPQNRLEIRKLHQGPNTSIWSIKNAGRYYGSDHATLGLSVHKDDVFVILKRGDVMKTTGHCGFEKIMDVNIPKSMMFIEMFHRLVIVMGVENNEDFSFKRYDIHKERAFLFQCPDLGGVTEHGEMLIMGYNDGKIKIYMPRMFLEENVLLFEKQFTEVPVLLHKDIVAVDVYEEKGRNHLFIANNYFIAHVVFDHKDIDDYVWSEYPLRVSLHPDQPPV